MADNCFSQVLYLSYVSQTSENGFYGKKSRCMSCPNTKSIDIFSLGTYLDHSGAIFEYMMDLTDNKLDPKWQIIDFHRFYTRTVCPRLLSMALIGKKSHCM